MEMDVEGAETDGAAAEPLGSSGRGSKKHKRGPDDTGTGAMEDSLFEDGTQGEIDAPKRIISGIFTELQTYQRFRVGFQSDVTKEKDENKLPNEAKIGADSSQTDKRFISDVNCSPTKKLKLKSPQKD